MEPTDCLGLAAVLAAVLGLIIVPATLSGREVPDWVYWICIGAFAVATFAGLHWAQLAPDRALAGREPAMPGLSKEEARAASLKRMSWGRIGTIALGAALLYFRTGAWRDPLLGWNLAWTAFAVIASGVAAFRAAQKWKSGVRPF